MRCLDSSQYRVDGQADSVSVDNKFVGLEAAWLYTDGYLSAQVAHAVEPSKQNVSL
jgi:hypothetical protein